MAVSAQLGVSLNGAVDGPERHRQERCAISSPWRLGTLAPQRDHDYEVDIENFPIGRGAMLRELEEDRTHCWHGYGRPPVSWLPVLGGWLVTRYDLAVRVMRDSIAFTVDDARFSTSRVVVAGVARWAVSGGGGGARWIRRCSTTRLPSRTPPLSSQSACVGSGPLWFPGVRHKRVGRRS
jgi:hypothetical protein